MLVKKVILLLAAFLMLLAIVLAAVPFIFEDQIKGLVKREIAKRVLAAVDVEELGLKLLRHLPEATITIDEFSIAHCEEPLAGDTLLVFSDSTGRVDLFSLIGGGPIEIAAIHLSEPRADLQVRADGYRNWEITAATPRPGADSTGIAAPRLRIAIQGDRICEVGFSYRGDSDDL
jgi:uncharacterized protein involved in outer membrane biogenesis